MKRRAQERQDRQERQKEDRQAGARDGLRNCEKDKRKNVGHLVMVECGLKIFADFKQTKKAQRANLENSCGKANFFVLDGNERGRGRGQRGVKAEA